MRGARFSEMILGFCVMRGASSKKRGASAKKSVHIRPPRLKMATSRPSPRILMKACRHWCLDCNLRRRLLLCYRVGKSKTIR